MMGNCEYAREYYNVPACIGRRVKYKEKDGVIAEDKGNYIGVNFDSDKPGVVYNIHPTDDNLTYLGMGKVRKMTRGQRRYKRYLEYSDCFETFIDFLYWDAQNPDN